MSAGMPPLPRSIGLDPHGLVNVAMVALEAQPAGDPVAWIRWRSDGAYEGPLMHSQMEDVRKQSGAWTPLYDHARPAGDPGMPVAAEVIEHDHGTLCIRNHGYGPLKLGDLYVRQRDAQAAIAARDALVADLRRRVSALKDSECTGRIVGEPPRYAPDCVLMGDRIAGLEADLRESEERIASIRTEWAAEVGALTERVQFHVAMTRDAQEIAAAAQKRIVSLESALRQAPCVAVDTMRIEWMFMNPEQTSAEDLTFENPDAWRVWVDALMQQSKEPT